MRKYLQLLAVMVATLFATSAMAFNPPASPKPAGNIVDQAHVLTQGELARLNSQLNKINNGSANEIGVLIVPSLGGENIRDVGYATAKAWGVGKRDLDNGVMIVWSPGERKIGIETGKGVEGDLPDIKCSDIIRNTIGPNFKDKHYEQGLSQGFTAIAGAIEDHRAAVLERNKHNEAMPPSNHANDPVTPAPVAQPHSSGDCAMATQQAGLGSGLLWIVILASAFWFLRGRVRKAARLHQQELDKQMQQHIAQFKQNMERDLAARQQTVVPVPTPVPVRQHVSPPVPVTRVETPVVPTTPSPVIPVVTAAAVTVALAEERERQARLRQLDRERQEREREETRQARLQQLEAERKQREREDEAAAAAAAAAAIYVGTSSNSDDDSSSSSSGGSDWGDSSGGSSGGGGGDSGGGGDFGGGDFGGGGASGDY
jgi:uncharacterized membrane protein YgcG